MHKHSSIRLIALVVAIAVLFAACGGGDDEPADGSDSPSTTTTRATTSTTGRGEATTTTAADSSGPALICEDPAPTEVGLGTALDSDLDSQQCFWTVVPDGSESVTISVTGLTTEARLGVYYGYIWNVQFPGAAAYWDAPRDAMDPLEVTIEDPQSGPYFFYLSKGRNAVSDFTVEVTTEPAATAAPTGAAIAGTGTCGGPGTVLGSGITVQGEILARSGEGGDEHHSYFCIEVAGAGGAMTIDLTEAEGYFDIQVVPPDFDGAFIYQNDRTLPDKSLTIEDVQAGAYYIDVGPALSGASGTFEITVTLG